MRLLALAIATTVAPSLDAQIHVAPTGNDANPGTATSPFRTINHAATVAAAGSTIYLQAATFGDEQGIVQLGTKDLVLQGAGADATILVPHRSSTLPLGSADPTIAFLVPHRVGIVVRGTARVHLRDLTIDAQAIAPVVGDLAGLHISGGADVVCDHVNLLDCRASSGSGLTHGLVVRGDVPINPSIVTIRDAIVTGFGNGGVRASLRTELDLQLCRIAGLGAAANGIDQCGVLVQNVAVASIRLSRITDCGGAAGAAVRLSRHGAGCLVEGNRISRAAIGIDLQHSPPLIVPGSVRNNRVAAVDTCVRVQGVSGVFVTGNSLFSVSRYDAAPVWDDSPGLNAWSANRFASVPATGSVPIPGGTNTDASAIAGTTELGDVQRVGCGGAPVSLVVADFDGDGRDDFATLDLRPNGCGLSVGLWRPTGHVVTSQSFGSSALQPVGIVAGNFDNLLGKDLAILTAATPPASSGAAFWVFANDGIGGMSLLVQRPLVGYVAPSALTAARLDANASDDLVITDRGAWPFTNGRSDLFLNLAGGLTWLATPLPVTISAAAADVASGDVDQDGKVDLALLVGSPTAGSLHWLRGNGFGVFTPSLGSPFAVPANPSRVLIADFDADGDRDILVAATAGALPLQRGTLQVFENRPGQLSATPAQACEFGPGRLVVADLDDDGSAGVSRPELLVVHPAAGNVNLFAAFERSTGFAGGGAVTLVDGPLDIASSDLDGDPWSDLVVAEPSRGGVALLHGSPTTQVYTLGRGCPGTAGREPRLEPRGAPGLAIQPNPTLQIGVVDGFPVSIAVCAIALGPGPSLAPCGYLLDAPLFLLSAPIDADGRGAISMPLPALPDAHGLLFCAQAGVLDPDALTSFIPQISLTAGLCFRVGD